MYNLGLGQAINVPQEFVHSTLGYPPIRTTFGPHWRQRMGTCPFASVVTEPSTARAWFGRNWKWLALGVGGVVAAGVALKIVL